MSQGTAGRRYSGQSFEDRRAERRMRLIQAAVQVAGRVGIEASSVAAICSEAGLTARYFYESFQSREALFLEAYRVVQEVLLERIGVRIDPRDPVRGAVTGFFEALKTNPGIARVFLVDLDDHGPDMKEASRAGARKLASLFAPAATHPLMAAGVLGAIIDIARRWIESGFADPAEKVVEIALQFTKIADGSR
jgi:AcrR family transcriptional regulator